MRFWRSIVVMAKDGRTSSSGRHLGWRHFSLLCRGSCVMCTGSGKMSSRMVAGSGSSTTTATTDHPKRTICLRWRHFRSRPLGWWWNPNDICRNHNWCLTDGQAIVKQTFHRRQPLIIHHTLGKGWQTFHRHPHPTSYNGLKKASPSSCTTQLVDCAALWI